MLKKGIRFTWSAAANKALESLKEALGQPLKLHRLHGRRSPGSHAAGASKPTSLQKPLRQLRFRGHPVPSRGAGNGEEPGPDNQASAPQMDGTHIIEALAGPTPIGSSTNSCWRLFERGGNCYG
uniref:Uncharacterized protein n=1 Tax=Photinus pyralis TaxID=7054 RepID=A0A1Y1K5Y7_PHOPY